MNTAAKIQSWEGQVVDGRFPLLQSLGESAGNDVFLTELPGGEARKAAVKLIPAEAATAGLTLSRWEAIAKLSHPHLMRLFHMGRCQINGAPLLYVVTEYAEENLSQVLPSRPLTTEEAAEVLTTLTGVLSFLHANNFVHSRVKPSNIMAVSDQLKLSSDCLQVSGKHGDLLAGAGLYDAPEIATGVMTPATDVWSLGMTLVSALNQHLPAWDSSQQGDPPVPASIPDPFREIARGCLHLDPKQRFTLKQVEALLQGAARPQAAGPVRKVRTGMLIGAQVVLVALLAGLWLTTHRRQAQSPPETVKPEQPVAKAVPPPTPVPSAPTTGVVKGEVVDRVLPNVPSGPKRTIQGKIKVSVRVAVDPDGHVSAASLENRGPSKYFANLALAAARLWKFKPAQVDGKAVSSKWILHFHFTRAATEVVPVETAP